MNETIEDYLKAIYALQKKTEKVGTTNLARQLAIAPASVTGMIKRLSEMNLVTYQRYQGVQLTENGKKIALEVIRHHRLIELFLAEALGVPWDRVHEEAEKWEHVLSEDIEERIDKLLGYPTYDPHGSPIPDRQGRMPKTSDLLLTDLTAGQQAVIVQVNSNNTELLRYLGSLSLYPKTQLRVEAVGPFDGPVSIKVKNKQYVLGRKVSQNIYVEVIEND